MKMAGGTIIVTRHRGAVEWLRKKYGSLVQGAKAVTHINPDDVPRLTAVFGVLPITLAKQLLDRDCAVFLIQMPNVPRELRGQELTAEMMEKYGAKLYRISNIEWEEIT